MRIQSYARLNPSAELAHEDKPAIASPRTQAVADVHRDQVRPLGRVHPMIAALGQRLRRTVNADDTVPVARNADTSIRGAALMSASAAKSPREALFSWIDLTKARAYAQSPSGLLRAVCHHHRRPTPEEFEATFDLSQLQDEDMLDEAALLYHELQIDGKANAKVLPEASALRATFMAALRADQEKQRKLGALFALPTEGGGQPFYDGFALRNATGKTFDDLIASPETFRWPPLQGLSVEQKRSLLEEKFVQMGQAKQYAIGTTEHALASTILRAQSYSSAALTQRFESEADVLKHFQQLEAQYERESGRFPVNPRLLFSLLLARSNGVDIVTPEQLYKPYVTEVVPRVTAQSRKGHEDAGNWLRAKLALWCASDIPWNERDEATRGQAVLSIMNDLHASIGAGEPVSEMAAELKQLGVLREWIIGANWQEKAQALLTYSNERLLAAYGVPPQFNRATAAADILLSYGMEEEDMDEERHYVITSDNPNLPRTNFGDRITEFLERADWTGLNGKTMRVAGKSIKPSEELEKAEELFNSRLVHDAWVQAKAKEKLRTHGEAMAQHKIDAEAVRLSKDFRAETETHRAWMRGFQTWINTVPVAGPIYNIEEGVRHKDALQVAFGLLFLGLDVFDLASGSGGSVRGGAKGVAPEHETVFNFRRAAGSVDVMPEQAIAQPAIAEAMVDPAHIGQLDLDIPDDLRGLAARVRDGAIDIRWNDYEVVHLRNENRVVPVEHAGGTYHEIDWNTGERTRHASLISRDAQTGTYRSGGGLKGGMRGSDGLIRGTAVEKRVTVEKVVELLNQATDVRVRKFDQIFDEGFEFVQSDASLSTFDAHAYFKRLYQTSGTFRRFLNGHTDAMDALRNKTAARSAGEAMEETRAAAPPYSRWQFTVGKEGPLGPRMKAYTDFDHRRIYLPSDTEIAEMPYMSASGVEAISHEQVYLHEMVHAMTGARDPERAVDMLNRGPVVYLTDRIMNEAGYSFSEQVMYRRFNSTPDTPQHDTIEYHREAAAEAAHAENRYLDRILDQKMPNVAPDTLVDGVPVSSRQTVEGAKRILEDVNAAETTLDVKDFNKKFDEMFAFAVSDPSKSGPIGAIAEEVSVFFRRLHKRSPTFRALFDKMGDVKPVSQWQFVVEKRVAIADLPTGKAASCVNRLTKRIYIFDDGTRYLTPNGLHDVEYDRKLVQAMVDVMTGLGKRMPSEEAFSNRGADVLVTERILKEAGYNFPKQLVGALATSADPASEARLLSHQTSALRSASVEDRYLG